MAQSRPQGTGMRAFVAIELSEQLQARVGQQIARLRKLAPDARWVSSDSLHLTLFFFGEVADAAVPPISEALGRIAGRHLPHTLQAKGGGTFGPLDAPAVLWVALGGELPQLMAMQREVSQALTSLGHAPDYETFEPHVTMARSRHPRGDLSLGRCADALRGQDFGDIPVGEIVLFASDTQQDGMKYSSVSRHALRRAPTSGPRSP